MTSYLFIIKIPVEEEKNKKQNEKDSQDNSEKEDSTKEEQEKDSESSESVDSESRTDEDTDQEKTQKSSNENSVNSEKSVHGISVDVESIVCDLSAESGNKEDKSDSEKDVDEEDKDEKKEKDEGKNSSGKRKDEERTENSDEGEEQSIKQRKATERENQDAENVVGHVKKESKQADSGEDSDEHPELEVEEWTFDDEDSKKNVKWEESDQEPDQKTPLIGNEHTIKTEILEGEDESDKVKQITIQDKNDGSAKKKFQVKPVEEVIPPEEQAAAQGPDNAQMQSLSGKSDSLQKATTDSAEKSKLLEKSSSPKKEFAVSTVKDDLMVMENTEDKEIEPPPDVSKTTMSLPVTEKDLKEVKLQHQVSVNEQDLSSFIEETTLLEDTEHVLSSYDVDNYSIFKTRNGKYYTIIFVDEGGERCEKILNSLSNFIGERDGTSLGIYPSSIFRGKIPEANDDDSGSDYEGEFRKSIKARLLVSQVVNAVEENAQFKFDYVMLVITASLIAAFGLIESSSVILVASMLVSPLMGPILAGTFGFVIKNYSLRNLGIASEIKGLIMCLIAGFLVGLIASSIAVHYGTLGGTESWPTDEMKSRGVIRGLIPGLLIALASGVGVALSVLGGNSGSLVGVAISASLLPPAVNCGMLWAHAIVSVIKPPGLVADIESSIMNNNQTMNMTSPSSDISCPRYLNNKYIPEHSCSMEIEAIILGFISLSLTILNILCIFLVGIIFLKIKEVAPQTSTSDEAREFWKNDVKIARDSYQTMKGKYSMSVGAEAKKFAEEWRKKRGDQTMPDIREVFEDCENDPVMQKFFPGSRPFSSQLSGEFADTIPSPFKFSRDAYHTYHGAQRRLSHLNRPLSAEGIRPTQGLDTIDETTPLNQQNNSSSGPRHVSFGISSPPKPRQRSRSFDRDDYPV